MTVRAVVFDLGHTIWDITPQPEALARAYAEMRARLTERFARIDLPEATAFQSAVRDVLHEASKTYFIDGSDLREPPPSEWVREACRRLGLELDEALLLEITPPLFATEVDGLILSDGTREAVAQLSGEGYALGCITNTLADTATIRAMLRKHDLESMMQSVVVSTEAGWRKPHRALFEKALRELNAAANEAVFVGDSPVHDIGGAKAAGMFAVLTTQYVTRAYPNDVVPPDDTINHLRDLRGVLQGIDRASGVRAGP